MKPNIVTDFEALWTVGDVAGYLKVSTSWVYKRAESGELPHLRIGGHLRFDPDQVRRWVRSQAHTPIKAPALVAIGTGE